MPPSGSGGGQNKGLIIGLVAVIVVGVIAVIVVLLSGGDDNNVATDTTTTLATTTTAAPTTTTTEEPTTTTEPPTTATTEPLDSTGEMKSVFDLDTGDCWDDPDDSDSQFGEVEVIDCDLPHDNEVFYIFDLTDGEFDVDTVSQEANDGCKAEFEDFVGEPYDTSALYLAPLYPTAESWDSGDREVICSVFDQNKKLVGTMEDAGI